MAAEVIYERADAEKSFMGLTSFSGELPALKDISIAKNYLSADELKILNNLVSGYFDLAEINAIEHKPMYMNDYVGVSVVILSIIGVIHIDGRNQISMLWLWLFSAFINSVMQEVLVRGYLYQMIKIITIQLPLLLYLLDYLHLHMVVLLRQEYFLY